MDSQFGMPAMITETKSLPKVSDNTIAQTLGYYTKSRPTIEFLRTTRNGPVV